MNRAYLTGLAVALCFLLCLTDPSLSAQSANTVWEVRASGASDNNGGGFKAGATGTDYTQQNAAQLTLTDLATTGVVTTLTSVTGGFTAQMVGDDIQIVSGTNFTAGFYEITAFTNSNTVTVDRAPSTAAGAAGTGSVGGALATLGKLAGAMVASNKAYLTGAFTSTTTTTFAQSAGVPLATAPATRLIGYGAARGDATHATLTLSTNTGLTGLAMSNGTWIEQIDVDCGLLGTSKGISNSNDAWVQNCKISRFTSAGISGGGTNATYIGCEVTTGTSAASGAVSHGGAYCRVLQCNIHDNACPGIVLPSTGPNAVKDCLITNNTGASSDGINSFGSMTVLNNTIHGNGRHGIFNSGTTLYSCVWLNNILSNNGGFGIVGSGSTAIPATLETDGNAYFSNASGTRSLMDSVTGIFGVNPYANTRDVILTASPYVGPTTGSTANFALNSTSGGGAACKGAGSPGTWPGNTGSTGFLDLGAVQTKAGGGGPPQIISGAMADGFSFSLALLAAYAGWKRRKARQIS